MTNAGQREAWAQIHQALIDYIINYGNIQFIDKSGKVHTLDADLRFLKCGVISNKE